MTHCTKRHLIAAGLAMAALTASAEGYQINTLSAKQLGMGHAGVAMKLGSESMFFNPAGLGFSDKTLDISGSITGIKAVAKATYEGTEYETQNGLSTPLSVNASFRIYDNLQAGISFYTPYGSSINWTNDWPGSILNQKVDLKVYTIQPTVAWRITPKLSVGAGLMVSWGKVDLNKALVSGESFDALTAMMGIPTSLGDIAAASVNLTGTAQVSVGANIGAMYEFNDQWTAGVSFRTRMQMKVKAGIARVSYANETTKGILEPKLGLINEENFKAAMPCPYVLNFGVAYKPIQALTLAFDAQLTGWKTYRQLNINFPEPLSKFNQSITKDYRNAWAFHIGAQYALTHRFDVRAGLMVDTSPVNIDYYNPETPGMTKIEPTAGFSFRPIERLSVDVAFMYIAGTGIDNASCTYEDLLLKESGNPAYMKKFTADYRVHAFAPSIGLSYAF